MTRALRNKLAITAAAPMLLAAFAIGPAGASAASCKGADKPAYQLSSKAARKATLCLLNRARAAHGMDALKDDSAQRKAAKRHTSIMLRKNCFDHQCPGEKDLVGRISDTSYLPCVCEWYVGENLAYGDGSEASPRKVVAAWMGSPPHRDNILNPKYEDIGIGIADGAPTGASKASTYTTDFGSKR